MSEIIEYWAKSQGWTKAEYSPYYLGQQWWRKVIWNRHGASESVRGPHYMQTIFGEYLNKL